MDIEVTKESEKACILGAVNKGETGVKDYDKPSVVRENHREGVLAALRGYRRRLVVNRGVLQRYKRRRKGTKNTVKRQAEDKQTAKVAFLTPELRKQTDNESVRGQI